ncbi:MAG: hypothetical protein ACTHOF_04610 [Flavisolibacter sp.]|jgi:hypothetical protein
MNIEEVAQEVIRDFHKLLDTTIMRLCDEYERERKKLKIARERTYTKVYTVKTARKNNWIIFIAKQPAAEVYTDRGQLSFGAVTYFWDDEGLKVLEYKNTNVFQVYKGHLFTRYNSRMKLGLDKPVDIIKHFFIHNCYSGYETVIKNHKVYFIGFAKDGLLLGQCGELSEKQGSMPVVLWRTFVSRDLIRHHQAKKEKKRIKEMEHKTLKAFVERKDHHPSYMKELSVLKMLSGQCDVN